MGHCVYASQRSKNHIPCMVFTVRLSSNSLPMPHSTSGTCFPKGTCFPACPLRSRHTLHSVSLRSCIRCLPLSLRSYFCGGSGGCEHQDLILAPLLAAFNPLPIHLRFPLPPVLVLSSRRWTCGTWSPRPSDCRISLRLTNWIANELRSF